MAPRDGPPPAVENAMRTFLTLVVLMAGVGATLKYRESQKQVAAVAVQPASPAAAPGKHWPKQALDRAAEVKSQLRKERAEGETEP
ncbi:hypothetical protein BH20VER2_BH20VER2_09090 [soil metagenome]